MLNSVNNPTDALQKANMDPSFLKTVKGYLNNPMYGFLLPMIGINKQVALQKIDELEKMMTNEQSSSTDSFPNSSIQSSDVKGFTDDLERYRRGLNSFK